MVDHWRVFLPVAMVCLALWYVHSLRSERDDALASLANYQAQVEDAQRQRRILNMVIEQRLALELAKVDAVYESQMNTLLENYNATLEDKAAAVATAADLRRQLRDTLQTATAARMSEDRARLVGPACGGRDSDTAGIGYDAGTYTESLEHACAVTTLDYNTLYDRCSAINRIYGD